MASAPKSAPTTNADVLVIFGITGDLARVMTFRSLYRLEARGLLKCPVVGVAFDEHVFALRRGGFVFVGCGDVARRSLLVGGRLGGFLAARRFEQHGDRHRDHGDAEQQRDPDDEAGQALAMRRSATSSSRPVGCTTATRTNGAPPGP